MDKLAVEYSGMNLGILVLWLLLATLAGFAARKIVRGRPVFGLWGDIGFALLGVFLVGTLMKAFDFSLTGSILSPLASTDISVSTAAATTASNAIDTAITSLNQSLATMGSQAAALDIQNDFLSSLSDVIEQGIGNLVDADLAKESARLQSLQIKQQLGAQALSIANQAPSLILSFFR